MHALLDRMGFGPTRFLPLTDENHLIHYPANGLEYNNYLQINEMPFMRSPWQ